MYSYHPLKALEPIDYLVIGHITQDLTPQGPVLGGTASYSALTAKALGLKVGIVTSNSPDLQLDELEGIQIAASYADHNTTFENINTPGGRIQFLHHRADANHCQCARYLAKHPHYPPWSCGPGSGCKHGACIYEFTRVPDASGLVARLG